MFSGSKIIFILQHSNKNDLEKKLNEVFLVQNMFISIMPIYVVIYFVIYNKHNCGLISVDNRDVHQNVS